MSLQIHPLKKEDLAKVREFADLAIGTGYYTLQELESLYVRSQFNGRSTSFVLMDTDTGSVMGLRLSFGPGKWSKGKGDRLRSDLWKVPFEKVAYFQSLFVHPSLAGQGWGVRLSEEAVKVMREIGAKAIVCHSWVESPGDSSRKYLSKMGFETVVQHPLYWNEVDYVCTRCGKPCLCTAEEMILRL